MHCPTCHTQKNVVKAGIRYTKKGPIQKYYCKHCTHYFTTTPQPYLHYPLSVILYTLTSYNKGYPIQQVKKRTGKKYHLSPPIRTIYSWITRYQHILGMLKLRKNYQLDPEQLITTHTFHHQQLYPFSYHNLKLNIASKQLPQLRRYINWIERSLPDTMFLKGPRASTYQTERDLKIRPHQQQNNITTLATLALQTHHKKATTHETIEEFFLINDHSTICTELPVFLNPSESPDVPLPAPLTGHIDVLQRYNNQLLILDYKPNLNHPEQHIAQLYWYKKALQYRTNIPEHLICCAVFNHHTYYELVSPATPPLAISQSEEKHINTKTT